MALPLGPTTCARGGLEAERGKCWACPTGYRRSTTAAGRPDACVGHVSIGRRPATHHGSAVCPAGSFHADAGDGCWTCPDGHIRSDASVTGARACAATARCEPGLLEIRGVCEVRGRCGGKGERPCLGIERIPACEAGLYADETSGRCRAYGPGETVFDVGIAALRRAVAADDGVCGAVLRAIPIVDGDIPTSDLGPSCTTAIKRGFVCAVPSAADTRISRRASRGSIPAPPATIPGASTMPARRAARAQGLSGETGLRHGLRR